MANQLMHDKMCVLAREATNKVSMEMSFSKGLNIHNMGAKSNQDGAADQSDNTIDSGGSDQEYIRQEYRFEALDGHVSSDGDFEDIIDRFIPINRKRSKRIVTTIDVKELRNTNTTARAASAMARDISYAVDLACSQEALNSATMAVRSSTGFAYSDAFTAETLMVNRGLGAYSKKLCLSSADYQAVGQDLGQKQFSDSKIPVDAYVKAMVPPIATFDTARANYILQLPSATAAATINGNQSHTVSTYDANDNFYLDNRFMTLNMNVATAANFPKGTKFTIAGVNYLHPATRQDSGELMTFSVKSHTVDGAPVISPAIVTAGAYRTCSSQAANLSVVSILNTTTSAPSVFYTPESLVLVPGRLGDQNYAGNVKHIHTATDQGIPIDFTYEETFHTGALKLKAAIYFDVQMVYPEQAGVILTNQA